MLARTSKSSFGVGRKHPVTMRKALLTILSMGQVCLLRQQTGAQYSTVEWTKERAEISNVLAPAPHPDPASRSQQRDSGGEFLAQSLEVVTENERPVQLYPNICWDWTGWQ